MAYDVPTAAEIKIRFPEFAAVADATIESIIVESGSAVSQRWIEVDYKPAIMFYVAHELRMGGQGSSAAAQISQIGDFSSIKSGDLEVRRNTSQSGGSSSANGTFALTTYGQKFLELRNRSFPGILSF